MEFLDFLVSFLGSVEVVMPIKEFEDGNLTLPASASCVLNHALPSLRAISVDLGSQYGSQISLLVFYTEAPRSKIRSCYKRYMQSTIAGEDIFASLNPLLRQIQESLNDIERFPLFLDLLEMDIFMLKKVRPEGIVTQAKYQGIAYPDTDIDPLWKRSGAYLLSLTGEVLEPSIPSSSSNSKQKCWFKKTTGLRRRGLYLIYLQDLILLNLLERFVYGYSTRDGADFAIKLAILAAELDALLEPDIADYFAFGISLAEVQLRQAERPDGMTSCNPIF